MTILTLILILVSGVTALYLIASKKTVGGSIIGVFIFFLAVLRLGVIAAVDNRGSMIDAKTLGKGVYKVEGRNSIDGSAVLFLREVKEIDKITLQPNQFGDILVYRFEPGFQNLPEGNYLTALESTNKTDGPKSMTLSRHLFSEMLSTNTTSTNR